MTYDQSQDEMKNASIEEIQAMMLNKFKKAVIEEFKRPEPKNDEFDKEIDLLERDAQCEAKRQESDYILSFSE